MYFPIKIKFADFSGVNIYNREYIITEKKTKANKIPFITEIGIKVNKDKEYEYDNTQDIVYTTANNELKLQKKFENKRKRFEDLFGLNNIPNITTPAIPIMSLVFLLIFIINTSTTIK